MKFRIESDIGLIPTSDSTAYNIHVGFKGNVMAYLWWSEGKPFYQLQRVNWRPFTNPDNLAKRYLGYWSTEDIPPENRRLVLTEVKNMAYQMLKFYNDSPRPQKLIMTMIINKLALEEVSGKKVDFYVKHYKDVQK